MDKDLLKKMMIKEIININSELEKFDRKGVFYMNLEVINKRENFYSNEFNLDRADKQLLELIKTCTFKEIEWIFRTIMYDQVRYDDKELCSIIYKQDRESLNIEQACNLQRMLSCVINLYKQSILDKKIFDEDYLKNTIKW